VPRQVVAIAVLALCLSACGSSAKPPRSSGVTQPGLSRVDLMANVRQGASPTAVSEAMKTLTDAGTLARYSITKFRLTYPQERPGALFVEFDSAATTSQRRGFADPDDLKAVGAIHGHDRTCLGRADIEPANGLVLHPITTHPPAALTAIYWGFFR